MSDLVWVLGISVLVPVLLTPPVFLLVRWLLGERDW
jgi:hypothetical protein